MNRGRSRRGATLVLVIFISSILLVMAILTIDVAYMQLVRTELRAATDAAAKAGTEVLSRAGSDAEAKQRAMEVAAMNQVGGGSLQLKSSEIELGRSTRGASGAWTFQPGAKPSTSIRIRANLNDGRSPSLLMGRLLGVDNFSPSKVSTSAYAEHDVCLVVDRSHSMCFDLTGVDWSYPPGTPNNPDPIAFPPHPKHSRWAYLVKAIESFVETALDCHSTQHVSLVSWGSDITLRSYEGRLTGQTFPATQLDVNLGNNHSAVRNAVRGRSGNVMLGGTNMSAGMNMGISVLTGASSRAFANKTMVLMTDGQWNQGSNPVDVARVAKEQGITIYTVTFLDGTNQSDMEEIASITGGRHFHASNGEQLVNIFEELGKTLPVVITD